MTIRWLTVAVTLACALLGGCAPTLHGYLEEVDRDGPVWAKAAGAPTRSPEVAVPKSIEVCRFEDGRSFGEQTYMGAAVADAAATVLTLGIAFFLDSRHQQRRDQPIGGLEDELPRRIAEHLAAANTFNSCAFANRSLDAVLLSVKSASGSVLTDFVLYGEVKAFTGECKHAPEVEEAEDAGASPPPGPHWEYCRGRIEVVLTLFDARTSGVVWTDTVATLALCDNEALLADTDTTAMRENRLAVMALGAFLRQVDATLRGQLAPQGSAREVALESARQEVAPRVRFEAAAGSPSPVGPMAGRPAVGRMDGDPWPDVVVACGTCCGDEPDPRGGHVMVLLNDGHGAMTPAKGSPWKIGDSVRKVALGDVNEDGKLDVLAVEHERYLLTVLLGDGQGGLAPAPGSPFVTATGTRAHTHDVVVADVNGDHHLDALTTNVQDSTISVLLGDGKGGFAPAPASPILARRGPYDSIVVRDLDGDANLDLAVPCLLRNEVDILYGDGAGGFARKTGASYPVGERPGYLIAADVNEDDLPDLLVTHDDVGLLIVLQNDEAGRLEPSASSPLALSEPVWGLDAADFDGDGHLDLVLGAAGSATSPILLLGDGRGSFTEQKGLALPKSDRPQYVIAADMDGDSVPDLVVGSYGSGEVAVLLTRRPVR